MRDRDEYAERLKAKIDEWNAEIDELEARARAVEERARQSYLEQVQALRVKRDEAREKLLQIQNASGDAWETLKHGAESLWHRLTTTVRDTKDAFVEGMEEAKKEQRRSRGKGPASTTEDRKPDAP